MIGNIFRDKKPQENTPREFQQQKNRKVYSCSMASLPYGQLMQLLLQHLPCSVKYFEVNTTLPSSK
jgi:hypothetical protein